MAYYLTAIRSLNGLKSRHNRLLLSGHSKRCVSYILSKLDERKLICINGKDSHAYIQGMVTNDMRHLSATADTSVTLDSMYTFLLNVPGRVVADIFIYNTPNTHVNELLLDVDSSLVMSIIRFLKQYRVKRKVDISADNYRDVWALFPSKLQQLSENNVNTIINDDMILVKDPRLREFGYRMIFKSKYHNNSECLDKVRELFKTTDIEVNLGDVNDYHRYRYQLGVAEGVRDLPVEACFPLECNADYLHGVSFHKGCYVGQELTARIYHTGVIRKRIMPIEIIFDENENILNIENQETIVADDGKNVGKFRTNCGKYGISLLKVDDVLKSSKLMLSKTGLEIKTWRPEWWPKEVDRSSIPCGRLDHS